jgi:hypothetical protein
VNCVAAEITLQRIRAALHNDAAAIDDRDGGRKPIRFFEVMRREQDRHGVFVRESFDLPPERSAHLGIETRRRLVEEEHLRVVQQAERDVEPALRPARVRPHSPVCLFGQAEAFE